MWKKDPVCKIIQLIHRFLDHLFLADAIATVMLAVVSLFTPRRGMCILLLSLTAIVVFARELVLEDKRCRAEDGSGRWNEERREDEDDS